MVNIQTVYGGLCKAVLGAAVPIFDVVVVNGTGTPACIAAKGI